MPVSVSSRCLVLMGSLQVIMTYPFSSKSTPRFLTVIMLCVVCMLSLVLCIHVCGPRVTGHGGWDATRRCCHRVVFRLCRPHGCGTSFFTTLFHSRFRFSHLTPIIAFVGFWCLIHEEPLFYLGLFSLSLSVRIKFFVEPFCFVFGLDAMLVVVVVGRMECRQARVLARCGISTGRIEQVCVWQVGMSRR